MTAAEIAAALGGRKTGTGWSCRCPAHDDKVESLSVGEGKGGKPLVHCHAGCEQLDVIAALKSRALWNGHDPEPLVPFDLPSARPRKAVAEYPYTDANGALLYTVVRYEPKTFRQRRADGAWSMAGVTRTLYNLPAVIAAVRASQPVLVVEGEKDVETARAMGLCATTNAGGATKWDAAFSDYLVGAHVIIVPDKDEAGTKHANAVIASLQGKAASIRVAEPRRGKDLTDWAPTEAELLDAAVLVPGPAKRLRDAAELIADIKPIAWLVRDYFERDALSLVYGPPGGGKSFVVLDLAASVATGQPWLGMYAVKPGPVVYVAGEGHHGIARRLAAWQIHRGIAIPRGVLFKTERAARVLEEADLKALSDEISALGSSPVLVILDTLARNFGGGDENSTQDMSRFIELVDLWFRTRFGCAVVIVHHSGHEAGRARGSSALKAAVDAEYEVGRTDGIGPVTIKTTKMKDAELPGDLTMAFHVIELPLIDEDGCPVTSAVLVRDVSDAINTPVGRDLDDQPVTAAKALAAHADAGGWASLSALGDALRCSPKYARTINAKLAGLGFVDARAITPDGIDALSRTGYGLKK